MDGTGPKKFVFVLMPFSEEFTDVYQVGIKPACVEAGGYCERVDEQIFTESILERVYNQINKADLIIADMTGRNPNVFYEVGYAHALGKTVILLTSDSEDIPFDLKHYPHIVYGGRIASLKEELVKRVGWCLSQSQEPASSVAVHKILEFSIGGQSISEGAEIVAFERDWVLYSSLNEFALSTSTSIHNPTNFSQTLDTGIAFIFPSFTKFDHDELRYSPYVRQTRLPDGRLLSNVTWNNNLVLPHAWNSVPFYASFSIRDTPNERILPMTLRVFTSRGTDDINFSLVVPELETMRKPRR